MTPPTIISESVVTLEDTSFPHGSSVVLTDVIGRVLVGQALAFVGSNGSGKMTLMRALLGMMTVSRGRVCVNGAAPGKTPWGSVGHVPQLSDFDLTLPVIMREVVQMGMYSQLDILWRPSAKTRRRALEVFENARLADHVERCFGTLSGDQQQCALVVRCMTTQPYLIPLDEPLNGLDQLNRETLLSIIISLEDRGISLVVSTHDLVLAQETCEQAALLTGRQIALGPRDDVLVAYHIDEVCGGHDAIRLPGLRSDAGMQEPS